MKKSIIILLLILNSCKVETKKVCDKKEKEVNFTLTDSKGDFTLFNGTIRKLDIENTPWTDNYSSSIRFVHHNESNWDRTEVRNELIVYENGVIIKKYSGIKYEGVKKITIDTSTCREFEYTMQSFIYKGEVLIELEKEWLPYENGQYIEKWKCNYFPTKNIEIRGQASINY